MNSRNTLWTPGETHLVEREWLTTLPQYLICAGFGLLSGGLSATIIIGSLIIIKAFLLSPAVIFSPHITWLATAAILISLVISQSVVIVGRHVLPDFINSSGQSIHTIFLVSILASLSEAMLLFYTPS